MKLRLILVFLLLASGSAAFAQDAAAPRNDFSLELGTGLQPLHLSLLVPTRSEEEALAEMGREADISGWRRGSFSPTLSLSGVWPYSTHSEFILTAGVSWMYYRITQYGTFGTDPQGNPRYDLNDPSPAGWKSSKPVPTLSFLYRYIWNPGRKVLLYSGAGIGFVEFVPIPDITLLGVRFGGRRLYFFGEATLGPIATFVHGGLGWRFQSR